MRKPIRNPEAYEASLVAKAEVYDRRISQIIAQIGTYIAQNHYVLHGENEQRVISELHAEGALGQYERGSMRNEFSRNKNYRTINKEVLVREALSKAVETGEVLRYDDPSSGEVILSLPVNKEEEEIPEIEYAPLLTTTPDEHDDLGDFTNPVFRHLTKRNAQFFKQD